MLFPGGEGTSPLPSFTQLLVVLCLGLRPRGLSPTCLACSSVSSIFSSCLGSHTGKTFADKASDVTRRLSITAGSLILWLLQSSCLFCNVCAIVPVCSSVGEGVKGRMSQDSVSSDNFKFHLGTRCYFVVGCCIWQVGRHMTFGESLVPTFHLTV